MQLMKHLLNRKSLSKLTTTLVVCLWCASAWAGTAIGIHDFGPDITENQSCEIAKLKATKQLIEDELGQVIQVNDLKTCINDNCELNSFKWITFPGIVKKSTYATEIIYRDGRRYCVAQVDGFVMDINKLYDTDHDFSVLMNKNGQYHANDYMKLEVHAESKQYFAIFVLNSEAIKVYPNEVHPGQKVDMLTVPNSNYNIKMVKDENPNELLMVISSKDPFEMNDFYSVKDFADKIMDMKTKGFRIRMYDFVVQ
jgi:hypothetical protein